MKREITEKRGAVFGASTAFTAGFLCLACVLPGISAIVGISILVTAIGGIAEDGVLTSIGIAMLLVSMVLGGYVVIARRRTGAAGMTKESEPAPVPDEFVLTPSRWTKPNEDDTE